MPFEERRAAATPWTAERLRRCVEGLCGDAPVIVLANREPYRHEHDSRGGTVVKRSASGVVTALEPVIEACRGIWVAHGSGSADRSTVDMTDGIDVPPADPAYRLRRVWLDAEEERRYYYGFANEGLWPLCHRVHVRPIFRTADYVTYAHVNDRFAAAVCEEADTDAPVVLVQDYHFALAPQMIRSRLPQSTIVSFWHIPWPTPREFEICPWGPELVRGLLGSSIVGVHSDADRDQFLETVAACTDADVDRQQGVVSCAGHRTLVRTYPISIEWPNRIAGALPPVRRCRTFVRQRFGLAEDSPLIIGIDRLDYTKGIAEKALAVERLLERCPEYRGRLTFVQVAEPSRECLPAYRDVRTQLLATVERINGRFGDDQYRPIIVCQQHVEPGEVYTLLRAADVCLVGSLHDGMNLVAKEFVAARDDLAGVLVLSRFTGAARQLSTALLINPYAPDQCADVLARALCMPAGEQSRRMVAMRGSVEEANSYRWAGEMLEDAGMVRRRGVATRARGRQPQGNRGVLASSVRERVTAADRRAPAVNA